MQTFITDFNMAQNAKNLDNRRLGKQRVEGLTITSILLDDSNAKKGWRNHPAVKMWKGYEDYLIAEYIPAIFEEWQNRGFKNDKCREKWIKLYNPILNKFLDLHHFKYIIPNWITQEFIESHRSNLIRKFPEHYKPLFPDTKEGLKYIWPVK